MVLLAATQVADAPDRLDKDKPVDPTINLYDWYVCVRKGVVEALWPITARGALY